MTGPPAKETRRRRLAGKSPLAGGSMPALGFSMSEMIVAATGAELRAVLKPMTARRVLVPTMGALHAGHLALISKAREAAGEGGKVIVSIFVNPIQFDRPGDLAAYPRPVESDLAACRAAGVDVVFSPDADSMYFKDRSVSVMESLLSKTLCGATRPGHFDGVCTVVLKLFLLTDCDAAVFGEKDVQQLAIIRRMVRDLDVPVEIIGHPTVREADGLAMSSRNIRLNDAQRADASRIYQALLAAKNTGPSAAAIVEAATRALGETAIDRVDYLSLVDAETLQPVDHLEKPAVLAAAVFYGDVRLIDHVDIEVPAA